MNLMCATFKRLFRCTPLLIFVACGATPPPALTPPPQGKVEDKKPLPPSKVEESTPVDAETKKDDRSSEEIAEESQALKESYIILAEAQNLIIQEKIEEASQKFQRVAERTPDIPEAHYNLGVLAERSGVPQVARQHYADAIKAQPDFSPALLALTRYSIRSKDERGALSRIEDKLRENPENIGLLNAKSRLLISLKEQPNEVVRLAKVVLRSDEQNVYAMIHLAAAFSQQKKYELSIAILKNAKELDPTNPEIYARLSASHSALNESVLARLALEEAVKQPGGSSAEIHNQLGLLYHKTGDYPSAAQQFTIALSLWPQMIEAQVNLGNALKGQQRFMDSSNAFQQALSMRPKFPPALFNLGILYLDGTFDTIAKQDQLKQAMTFFDQFLNASKNGSDRALVTQYKKECERLIEIQKKIEAQQKATMPSDPSLDDPEGDDPEGDDPELDEPGLDEPAEVKAVADQPPTKVTKTIKPKPEDPDDDLGIEVEELDLNEKSKPTPTSSRVSKKAKQKAPAPDPSDDDLDIMVEEVDISDDDPPTSRVTKKISKPSKNGGKKTVKKNKVKSSPSTPSDPSTEIEIEEIDVESFEVQ